MRDAASEEVTAGEEPADLVYGEADEEHKPD